MDSVVINEEVPFAWVDHLSPYPVGHRRDLCAEDRHWVHERGGLRLGHDLEVRLRGLVRVGLRLGLDLEGRHRDLVKVGHRRDHGMGPWVGHLVRPRGLDLEVCLRGLVKVGH